MNVAEDSVTLLQRTVFYSFRVQRYPVRPGAVQVSTGSLKMEKLSVVGHHVKSSILNLNAEDNLALAA